MIHSFLKTFLEWFDWALHLGRRFDDWWYLTPRFYWLKLVFIFGVGALCYLAIWLWERRKR